MTDNAKTFYDALADDYAYIFADWHASVERQQRILRDLLAILSIDTSATVLDCTCGIGTQTYALAGLGYRVHGSDLSPNAIDKARQHLAAFTGEQSPTFSVMDLLQPPDNPPQYDLVLALDNAIAHLHTTAELQQALQTMQQHTVAGGWVMLSLRDYDTLLQEKPRTTPISVNDANETRRIVYQVWDWQEGTLLYRMQLFVTEQHDDGWATRCHETLSRAWQRAEVDAALAAVGVTSVMWHMPPQTGFYQPIVTGRVSV